MMLGRPRSVGASWGTSAQVRPCHSERVGQAPSPVPPLTNDEGTGGGACPTHRQGSFGVFAPSKKLPVFMRVCGFSSFSPGTGEKVPQADEGACI